MIDIITVKGEKYSYDEDTKRIFKDGFVMPSTLCEPIFSPSFDENTPPKFSGIYLKELNSILSLFGHINPVSDINQIY